MTQHKNVYAALAAAQAEMGKLTKGSVNPAFKSKYADLADVVNAVSGALNAQGLAFFHQFIVGETHIMRTSIVHGDSETRIDCDVPLIVAKNDMQGMKSATTYAKRIGLESVTGVAPDDDDGNAASKAAPVIEEKKISTAQADHILDLIVQAEIDQSVVMTAEGVKSLNDIKADRFEGLTRKLQKTIDAKAGQ